MSAPDRLRLVVVESPYSSGTPEFIFAVLGRNEAYLRACLKDSLGRGESPFASHGLYTQPGVLDDHVPQERRRGIEAGFAWLAVAHLSASYVDLGVSRGMREGVERARALGIPVEERRLGGKWARCLDVNSPLESPGVTCSNVAIAYESGDSLGPLERNLWRACGSGGHRFSCPLWRAPE